MFAVAPDLSTSTFVTNANLVVTPNEGGSVGDLASAQTSYLEQLGATNVTSTEVDVDGSPALKAEYSLEVDGADGAVPVYGIQYVVFGDVNVGILTVTSVSDTAAEDAEAMAQSLVVE